MDDVTVTTTPRAAKASPSTCAPTIAALFTYKQFFKSSERNYSITHKTFSIGWGFYNFWEKKVEWLLNLIL
jgi:hypothetical protein